MNDYDPFMWQEEQLRLRFKTYRRLLSDAEYLLWKGALDWKERLLLEIVRRYYDRQLKRAAELFPAEWLNTNRITGENMALLEAATVAASGGHELEPWEKTKSGYQANCRLCQSMVYVAEDGGGYSFLGDMCPDRRETPQ